MERDHVPPKNLFPEPRPSDLVTVPSCRTCNATASKDDEYFRLVTSIRYDIAKHPDAAGVWPTSLRGLRRPEHLALRKTFLRGVRRVEVRTPAGLYLGKAGAYDVDLGRLNRVATRVVRGLFFHHMGYRLPDSCGVDARCTDGIDSTQADVIEMIRNWVGICRTQQPIVKGQGTFRYWYRFVDDQAAHPNSSVWLLLFYDTVAFFGMTVDNQGA